MVIYTCQTLEARRWVKMRERIRGCKGDGGKKRMMKKGGQGMRRNGNKYRGTEERTTMVQGWG